MPEDPDAGIVIEVKYATVSYTHLDVYKRQALHAAELVHTLPAGYFDLSGLWYAQCYHDYISFRFC